VLQINNKITAGKFKEKSFDKIGLVLKLGNVFAYRDEVSLKGWIVSAN